MICTIVSCFWSCHGRMVVGFTPMPITTKVVSSNPTHSGMYSIQQYVIKFVNELRLVGSFLRVLRIDHQ